MRLATTTCDFDKFCANHAESVRAFEGTGFRHLDANFYTDAMPGAFLTVGDWLAPVRDMAREAERLGFDFVQAHAPNLNCLDPGFDFQRELLHMERTIEACAYLGIDRLVYHTGSSPDIRYPGGRAAYYEANFPFIRAMFPVLERTGVQLLIENTCSANVGERYFPITGEDMLDFVRTLGHPNVHCCWDTGHANIQGLNHYDDIRTMGSELYALHVQDNHGKTDDHVAPFMGTLDVDAIMHALVDTGYSGCFTFESSNILIPFNAWPNYRRQMFTGSDARVPQMPLDVVRQAIGLLYSIGRCILESYGIPVE